MAAIPSLPTGGRRTRVLIVDDSAVIRRALQIALEQDPSLEVVGTANHGVAALQRLAQLAVDVVTLDIEMPEMDGLETLRRIRASHPKVRVIMFSTFTERAAAITMEALSLGAADYVTKPSSTSVNPESQGEKTLDALRVELIPKIKQFFQQPPAPARTSTPTSPRTIAPQAKPISPEVLAIGASTGGPTALNEIMPQIPPRFPLPVLITQHMPPMFTKLLADRLALRCKLPVEEAKHGSPVEGGHIYIAPGNFHMRVTGQPGRVKIVLDQSAPENSCRPAVDPLFRSVAEVWGVRAVGVILTGMGHDGLLGCEALRAKGALIFAQDEATSVVWGMPGFVARAGLADKVLPLSAIIPEIAARVRTQERAGAAGASTLLAR